MNGQNRLAYLIKRMVYRFFSDGIPQAAAELSYFLLFSMFPLLMFVNSVLAQLDISIESIQPVLELLPKSLQQLITSYLAQLSNSPSFSPMLIGIVLTLYFLSRAVRSMMRTVAGRTIIRILPRLMPVPQAALDLTHDASFWVMIAFIFVFLMLFNRVVPNLHLKFQEVWPGALFSLVAWLLVSWAFSFYVDNMANYSVLYGSLGAIIVLMLWLYIVSMILLMGPQLNHTLVIMRLYRMEAEKHFQ